MSNYVLRFNYLNNSFNEIKKDIKEIKTILDCHSTKLEEHNKKIKNLEKKTETIEEINDFDKIVLSDFGSRITILEEESEKYIVN